VSKPIQWEANGELTGGTVYMHLVKDNAIVALGPFDTAKTG